MLLRESVEHCANCGELTPHSRRLVAWPEVVGAVMLVGGAMWIVLALDPLMAGVLAIAAAPLLLVLDRRRHWRVACERRRGERRRSQPGLLPPIGRNTEIGLS